MKSARKAVIGHVIRNFFATKQFLNWERIRELEREETERGHILILEILQC